jgi:hypothetical protein
MQDPLGAFDKVRDNQRREVQRRLWAIPWSRDLLRGLVAADPRVRRVPARRPAAGKVNRKKLRQVGCCRRTRLSFEMDWTIPSE